MHDVLHRGQLSGGSAGSPLLQRLRLVYPEGGVRDPGWMAFTRMGASAMASVRTRLVTPPLMVVTMVEPG